jgi:hypothetical protein
LAQQIQTYYGNLDDLLDTNTVFRMFRNDGAREQFALGVSVFDQRPDAESIALARQRPSFAAHLRSQREWAILHHHLLRDLSREARAARGDRAGAGDALSFCAGRRGNGAVSCSMAVERAFSRQTIEALPVSLVPLADSFPATRSRRQRRPLS